MSDATRQVVIRVYPSQFRSGGIGGTSYPGVKPLAVLINPIITSERHGSITYEFALYKGKNHLICTCEDAGRRGMVIYADS